jgi:peptide-methionine (R)-S-oxide reductase
MLEKNPFSTLAALLTGRSLRSVSQPSILPPSGSPAQPASETDGFAVRMSDVDWRRRLTPDAYRVLRRHGTEQAGSSALNREKRSGQYACAGCGHLLFDARDKFDSRTGWPSFRDALPGGVGTKGDRSHFMNRVEVHCGRCGGHLGHVFEDGPQPTGLRYCTNGVSLAFQPD